MGVAYQVYIKHVGFVFWATLMTKNNSGIKMINKIDIIPQMHMFLQMQISVLNRGLKKLAKQFAYLSLG